MQEDTDVARERAHVMQGGGEGDVISLRGLHKHYAGMHDPVSHPQLGSSVRMHWRRRRG